MNTIESAPVLDALLALGHEPKVEFTESESKRFFDKIRKEDRPDGCWLWTGCVHSGKGYAHFRFRGKPRAAHRVSYLALKGPIPDVLVVCHRCDVRNCVNPGHLWLGTHKDNVNDMVVKGRAADGSQVPRGEDSCNAKITEAQVHEIRRLYQNGVMSQRRLGEKFGLQQMQVSRILKGKRWAHLNLTPITRPEHTFGTETEKLIREKYSMGRFSQARLAEIFETSQSNISRICARK